MHQSAWIISPSSMPRKVSLDGISTRSDRVESRFVPTRFFDEETPKVNPAANLDHYGIGNVTPTNSRSPSPSSSFRAQSTTLTSTTSANQRNVDRAWPSSSKRHSKDSSVYTVKGHQRQFARHNYHDHANDEPTGGGASSVEQITDMINVKGGVKTPFPLKLHAMLEAVEKEGLTDIVSWQPHGRAFVVHDSRRFVNHILHRFFQQNKYSSFQRQLNLYGFQRLARKGPDHGGYYHELFLRHRVFLCTTIQRIRVKGTLIRTTSTPETEPDFYRMPAVEASSDKSEAASTTTSRNTTPSPTTAMADDEVTPPGTPTTQTHLCPSCRSTDVDEYELVQTRCRLDQVLANAAGSGQQEQEHRPMPPPQQQQYQYQPYPPPQPVVHGRVVDDHHGLEPIPQYESPYVPNLHELAFFLDKVDFYAL